MPLIIFHAKYKLLVNFGIGHTHYAYNNNDGEEEEGTATNQVIAQLKLIMLKHDFSTKAHTQHILHVKKH